MFLHIMVGQNPKKSKKKKLHLFIHMMWCLIMFLQKKCTSQHIEKCKYIQEMIEIIFK
jgi:hypothetical protein